MSFSKPQVTLRKKRPYLVLFWSAFSRTRTYGEVLRISYEHFSLSVIFFSGFASLFSVMKQNSSVLFWLKKSYNLFKRSPLKCAFLNLFGARIKIRQIPHINFEMANQFQFKFRIIPHFRFKLIHFILWIKGTHQSP